MAKYLLVYRGGSMPEDEAAQAQVMAAWDAWFTSIGGAVSDPGEPTSVAKTIRPDGTVSAQEQASVSGYTVLTADSLDAAVALAKGCPVLAGGASIEVCETLDVM
jgi:hypothetical protein